MKLSPSQILILRDMLQAIEDHMLVSNDTFYMCHCLMKYICMSVEDYERDCWGLTHAIANGMQDEMFEGYRHGDPAGSFCAWGEVVLLTSGVHFDWMDNDNGFEELPECEHLYNQMRAAWIARSIETGEMN